MAIPKAGPGPLAGLDAYLKPFAQMLSRVESREALERYTTGLLADIERKTASGIGRSIPETNSQRLQEFLTRTDWDPAQMDRLRIGHMLAHATAGRGALVLDDTGFAKKGTHTVGVARQYSGTLGRVDNCQVLVTCQYVDAMFDWPVNARLYLPEVWTNDPERCRKAMVPEKTGFATKGEIALTLIDEALEAGVKPAVVVFDAGYGDQPSLLDGLESRRMAYGAAVSGIVRFRLADAVRADSGDPPAPEYRGTGRPRKASTLETRVASQEARAIIENAPPEDWETVTWRQGRKGALVKQCVRIPVFRTGLRGRHLDSSGWLIGERPLPGHSGETKYFFTWGLDGLSLEKLIEQLHVRWVIERFYQDAKGELGLDHYEGRLWQGFHRHVSLVMLAHCFLTLQQTYGPAELISGSQAPSGAFPPPWGETAWPL